MSASLAQNTLQTETQTHLEATETATTTVQTSARSDAMRTSTNSDRRTNSDRGTSTEDRTYYHADTHCPRGDHDRAKRQKCASPGEHAQPEGHDLPDTIRVLQYKIPDIRSAQPGYLLRHRALVRQIFLSASTASQNVENGTVKTFTFWRARRPLKWPLFATLHAAVIG
jgi:hypothetical protein